MCMLENNMVLTVRSKHRLPKDVAPRHYAITLRPDFETRSFTGGEVIDIKVKRQLQEISLNAKDLTITSAYLTDELGTRINAAIRIDEEHELAVLDFGGSVGNGKWQLHVSFSGQITDKLHGLYSSVYTGPDGKRRTIFSTQMEPCDARRLFPCFDEPAFKAHYTLRLVVDPDAMVISNGAITSEQIVTETKEHSIDYGNGLRYVIAPARRKKIVDFATTMKMSTYLTACVVGDFDVSQTIKVNGTPVRVICPRGKLHMVNTALKAAVFSLNWFEKTFGIKYPGGKLDLVAVANFAFGAMENTGCIIFRDLALLVDERTATVAELMRVVYTVAHEIAHQWFGNLVTMEWWDDLWLNEAFATLMGYMVVDAFCKEWDQWTAVCISRANAMRVDGLLSSRPVQGKVLKARDATGAFDAITYRKGASILRQLEQFIGWIPFRNGVRAYLKKHAHANTVGADLWSAIDETSNRCVTGIMDGWINQAGHPLITVTESDINGSVTLNQRTFKYLADEADNSLLWQVPVKLRYKVGDGVQEQWVLLRDREQTVYLGENVEWVVANAGAFGFYRVQYSPTLLAKLVDDVQNRLSAAERFNLLNDSWACVQAGLQPAVEYVEAVRLFSGETDPNVWALISSSLARLHRMIADPRHFESFVRDLAQPTLARLGYQPRQGESLQDAQVRGAVIALLGTTGNDGEVQARAKQMFDSYLADNRSLAPDLVAHIIRLSAHAGEHETYKKLRGLLAATTSPQDSVRFIAGLTAFRNQDDLLQSTLQAVMDGTIRSQDACSVIAQLFANPVTSRKTWQFVKDNWNHIITNFPVNNLATMIESISNFDSSILANDVQRFLAEHKVPGGDKTVEQSLESLRINVRLHERESNALRAAFASPREPAVPAMAEPAATTEKK